MILIGSRISVQNFACYGRRLHYSHTDQGTQTKYSRISINGILSVQGLAERLGQLSVHSQINFIRMWTSGSLKQISKAWGGKWAALISIMSSVLRLPAQSLVWSRFSAVGVLSPA